jgi:hypothetical protein
LTDRLNACPAVDDGGATSTLPKIDPLSFSRSLGAPPTESGTPPLRRMLARRSAESAETPAAWSPGAPVLRRLCQSLSRRPSWNEKL